MSQAGYFGESSRLFWVIEITSTTRGRALCLQGTHGVSQEIWKLWFQLFRSILVPFRGSDFSVHSLVKGLCHQWSVWFSWERHSLRSEMSSCCKIYMSTRTSSSVKIRYPGLSFGTSCRQVLRSKQQRTKTTLKRGKHYLALFSNQDWMVWPRLLKRQPWPQFKSFKVKVNVKLT